MSIRAGVSELFKIWSEKSWKKFRVLSSVQGEASTGWSLHQALPKAGISSVLCLGLPWWGEPWPFPLPLSGGLSRARHTQHRTSVAIKLSMGADYPQSCPGGREGGRDGQTLCLDQRQASFYIGVCKIRLYKPPPAPSLKVTPTFFSWVTHC